MVSDPVRALKSAKSPEVIDKYERTYLTTIDDLTNFHGDKKAYDELIKDIIRRLRSRSNRGKYYLAAFPFYITTNVQIYSIIFFTNNKDGFKLFKKTAWKTFGGKSSNKRAHEDKQISFFDTSTKDNDCYFVSDIVNYIVDNFKDRKTVLLQEIWDFVDEHPIFPTEGYIQKIQDDLRERHCCEIRGRKKTDKTIIFV